MHNALEIIGRAVDEALDARSEAGREHGLRAGKLVGADTMFDTIRDHFRQRVYSGDGVCCGVAEDGEVCRVSILVESMLELGVAKGREVEA